MIAQGRTTSVIRDGPQHRDRAREESYGGPPHPGLAPVSPFGGPVHPGAPPMFPRDFPQPNWLGVPVNPQYSGQNNLLPQCSAALGISYPVFQGGPAHPGLPPQMFREGLLHTGPTQQRIQGGPSYPGPNPLTFRAPPIHMSPGYQGFRGDSAYQDRNIYPRSPPQTPPKPRTPINRKREFAAGYHSPEQNRGSRWQEHPTTPSPKKWQKNLNGWGERDGQGSGQHHGQRERWTKDRGEGRGLRSRR